MHFKRAMILLKSAISPHSDDLMVMFPHSLAAVANLLELRPEATLAYATGCPNPLSVLLLGDSDGYLICVQTHETILGGLLHIRVGHILSGCVRVIWGPTVVGVALTVLIPSTPWGSSTVASPGSAVALFGLEGGQIGSCPCGSELGLASGANSGISSSPFVELCSLLTLTSWESTWVCLLHWSLRAPLEEWSHFFCMGPPINPVIGYPT